MAVGEVCLVNEFHDPKSDFHQVDIYFRCTITAGEISIDWVDPEGIMTKRKWASRSEMKRLRAKPDSLTAVAWGEAGAITYDALEPILR